MAKILIEKRIKALEMRKKGMSYSQIKETLKVSKSSLSEWLHDYPLSSERIAELRDRNPRRVEKFRNTMRLKRETRLENLYQEEKKKLLPFSEKELLIGGVFLYWGEGSKTKPCEICLGNTDPKLVRFFVYWLVDILKIPKENLRAGLHIYQDMNDPEEINYWSEQIGVPACQFQKSYIKATTLRGLTFKSHGHGTCRVRVYGRDITERVYSRMKVIADIYPKM